MSLSRVRICALFMIAVVSAPAALAVSGRDKAWTVLEAGIRSDNTRRRSAAIRSLALVPGDSRAAAFVVAALDDPKPEVRLAAATVVGQLRLHAAAPKLEALLNDEELAVTMAAAQALSTMKDDSAYGAYYAVLTGERKGKGLVAAQMETLRSPEKVARLGIGVGVGFVPFASIPWDAWHAMRSDDTTPVRALAASMLADDPDPKSREALLAATTDKSWIVRIAALEALGKRKEPDLLGKIELSMFDDRSEVRYAAAALVLHLSPSSPKKRGQR